MRPHIGQSKSDQHVLETAVLPVPTMDKRPHDVGFECTERRNGASIDVEDKHGMSQMLESGCDPAPGAKRDIAFVAQSAGEDRDT